MLHDVLEDSESIADDLRREGFPPSVVSAVAALTRNDDEGYEEFIDRVAKCGPLAVSVKTSDVVDNLARSWRAAWRDKIARYEDALMRLCHAGGIQVSVNATPLTEMLTIYRELPATADGRFRLADDLLMNPDTLPAAFRRSRERFSQYSNPCQAFHEDGAPVAPVPAFQGRVRTTVHVASACKAADVCRVGGEGTLDFRYVDRELDCLRRAPGVNLDDGTPAKRAIVLDLLLVNAGDATPILAELKTRGDKDAVYALIQVLAAAAHLTTPAQRERLLQVYGRDMRGATGRGPWIDLYVILYEPSGAATEVALLERAMQIAAALATQDAVAAVVRRIAFLQARLEDGSLRLEVVRQPDLRGAAAAALAQSFRVSSKAARLDGSGYVARLEENLLPGLSRPNLERLREEFGAGKGGELAGSRPKLHAVHSSAALAVNSFARWRERPEDLKWLELAGLRGFDELAFERPCPTGLEGTPPHLDALATGRDHIVAVESKLLEFLDLRRAAFSSAYGPLIESVAHPTWQAEYQRLVEYPNEYRYLDAAQLVKHYLGLKKAFPRRAMTLLYVYWEPQKAFADPVFRAHRAEIDAFSHNVADPAVRFVGESYSAIWRRWASRKRPEWAADHVADLRSRYSVSISGLRAVPPGPVSG